MKLRLPNVDTLAGLLTILFSLWVLVYFIPEVLVLLFHTVLGNLVLLCATLLLYKKRPLNGVLMGASCIVLYVFSRGNKHEGFQVFFEGVMEVDDRENKKSLVKEKVIEFLRLQSTINPHKVFDTDALEQHATQAELDAFLKDGVWPWSPQVVDLYEQAVAANPYVRNVPELATQQARTVFPEATMLRLLSYQTKEGQFLLHGARVGNDGDLPSGFGEFPYASGQMDRPADVVQCNLETGKLERTTSEGKTYPVDYKKLESILPGFHFVGGKKCNPCKAMASKADYSCPFQLKVKDKSSGISNVWRYLWHLSEPVTTSA